MDLFFNFLRTPMPDSWPFSHQRKRSKRTCLMTVGRQPSSSPRVPIARTREVCGGSGGGGGVYGGDREMWVTRGDRNKFKEGSAE